MAPRIHFTEQLQQLDVELLEMAGLVEEALSAATEALTTNDKLSAQKVIDQDSRVNHKERDIEALCLKLLLQQQPVARDLRLISAALKMISDLERIGDQAADISKIVVASLSDEGFALNDDTLMELAAATQRMVRGAVDAFVERSVDFAREVMKDDAEINRLFRKIRKELVDILRKSEDVNEDIIDRLMIAKYFERIGDHAQNIAEWVEYSQTGYHKGVLLA
jgi:phosphate transport system protein